jgi:hypothetical protein
MRGGRAKYKSNTRHTLQSEHGKNFFTRRAKDGVALRHVKFIPISEMIKSEGKNYFMELEMDEI